MGILDKDIDLPKKFLISFNRPITENDLNLANSFNGVISAKSLGNNIEIKYTKPANPDNIHFAFRRLKQSEKGLF